jgi:5'-deoxynucleotidase YfbR-like HD superfamily hydrolase
MNKFGVLRQKVLDKLTELYLNENKSELKQLVKEIKKDKKFSELHLFYENIEQKTINDKDLAELFVEEVTKLIKGNNKLKFNNIENYVTDVETISLNECCEPLSNAFTSIKPLE